MEAAHTVPIKDDKQEAVVCLHHPSQGQMKSEAAGSSQSLSWATQTFL
jgi:hypothetical protein